MYPEHTNSSDKENDGERALSIFEQIVLVLKKNMYHNEQLREKVRKAKLQLQQTDTVCKALAKKKEELEWANLG